MNKWFFTLLIALGVMLASFRLAIDTNPLILELPDKWPTPVYTFATNPLTEEGFQLGRKLFYDPNLSRDQTISCASCHLQYTGFTHVDHNVSHGIEGRKGTRNAPALINLIWNSSFHWDGGVNNLEVQPINPIQHPAEMDNTLAAVLEYLNESKEYKALFYAAFGDSTASSKQLLKSIAQFTSSLISSNSKYDQYIRKEVDFTKQEKNGLKLFRKNCAACHKEPLFNMNDFASNGLTMDTAYNDVGRYAISQIGTDSLQFRVPTLRNIEYTFPYMHDGRFRKLKEVLNHYTDGIETDNPYLSKKLRNKIVLSPEEKKDLIAFLHTLTDREFLYNRRFSFPR
jgi:cytochrome c peroxidase